MPENTSADIEATEYDYIVAGAGSAGCVVASRLSESGRYSVLLLEAGPPDSYPWIHVPLGYANVFANRRINWMFESEPEPALQDRRMFQPRGKVLGGTSSINGMVYIRGNRADYDGWRDRGCIGWSWDDVLPYFKKAEDYERGANDYHGAGGPLKVTTCPRGHELATAVIQSANQIGLEFRDDLNGESQEGIGYYDYTISGGRRWSAATAYLSSAKARPNLKIETGAHATGITFAGTRATGVDYVKGRTRHRARCRREVVVTCGVFGSPQILEASGLGSAERLKSIGVSPRFDIAAVGENLQDHFYTQLMFRCTKPITINDFANSNFQKFKEGLRYFLTRTGTLAATHIYLGGFLKTKADLAKPDIQFNFAAWSVAERTAAGAKPHQFPGFSINPIHLNPDARGSVHCVGPDPLAPPSIRFNYLQSEYDIQSMIFGFRLVRSLARQPSLASYIAGEIQPGPSVETDAEIVEFLRSKAVSNLHAVGSCAMGVDPKSSVVDTKLRVHGVEGLRVVDASIMPRIICGNTNAAVIMIAEKASDLILAAAA
jgi:choline dehydrogenase